MSNNPFLKSKQDYKPRESNNRFSSLDDDDTTNKSLFKDSSNKTNKKNIEYNSAGNSFTQTSKPHRDRDTRRSNETRSKPRETPQIVAPNPNDINLFPELVNMKETITNTFESSTNFKDILTNVIEEEKPKENPIPPGWKQLSRVNGQTFAKNGDLTQYMIKMQQKEDLKTKQENDPNHIMFNAIESMKKNWDHYQRDYDEINGVGAYDENFILTPVYGTDCDTESETDSDTEDEYNEM